jgi:hypothetical protein
MSGDKDARNPLSAEETISSTAPLLDESSRRHGQFLPGSLFGKRYRIVGLLGRGGMGEVYGADDLELGQTVALKLLPARLTKDEAALLALRNEVRITRKISHPNVCRVYDLGEVDGQYFVSMEYVDGEDLGGLLRRIGRLPREKAVDIIGQLAAGLSAAHESGVLHRDLKPANVMLDGRGRVHIMDFGLAGFAAEVHDAEDVAGTLAYMAPEQLAGKEASTRSDVYSLGLVMYEVLTGKRPYDSGTVDELRDRQASAPPSSPSLLVTDCDPVVERVVMRCLEYDPERRPASALDVAAALPGGNPLAAALAAGETPSPEMVAAAGSRGALPLPIGLGLLGLLILSAISIALLNNKITLHRLARLDQPPIVLAAKSREMLTQLGYPRRPVDVAAGFATGSVVGYIEMADSSVTRWNDLGNRRPSPYKFWYRECDWQMVPRNLLKGRVTFNDPPGTGERMIRLELDQSARLMSFTRVPPLRVAPPDSAQRVDWAVFFALAQLDSTAFRAAEPLYRPPIAANQRRAWEGHYPGSPRVPVRVEAAAWNGTPVYFILFDTGNRDWLLAPPADPTTSPAKPASLLGFVQDRLWVVLLPAVILLPALIAWKNVRARRGDVRGALRFALIGFGLSLINQTCTRTHYPGIALELQIFLPSIMIAAFIGTLLGLGYIAAEPYLRRLWPDLLISWTRLVTGRVRDPLVGRDILIGSSVGALAYALYAASLLLPTWFGHPMRVPEMADPDALLGGRLALGLLFDPYFIAPPMGGALFLVVFLFILRRKILAIAATFVVVALSMTDANLARLVDPAQLVVFAVDVFDVACAFFVILRFGLLALVAFQFFYFRLRQWPLTFDTSAWYASTSALLLVALGVIALYAFRVATPTRSSGRVRT